MATIKSIYLDDEAVEILDAKRKDHIDFNLSQFIQDSLKNAHKRPKLTYDEIVEKQRELQKTVLDAKTELEYIQEQREKYEIEAEQVRKDKIAIEMREAKKQKERMDSRIEHFQFFFKGIDNATATELAEEFDPIWRDKSQSMYQFLEGKGYIQKTADELDELEEKQKNGK
jgi:hypothetical protein